MTARTGLVNAGGGALARLPLVGSLRASAPGDRRGDVAAGLTVGVMLVPQGMAYALIAGLAPVYGLYAALAPLAVYALFGTSRQLAVGPVAMVSLLVAAGVAPLAGGDAARYLGLALALSALVGVLQLAMGLLRAGYFVNLLSHPVLSGFTAAAAILIGASQVPALLGVAVLRGEHPLSAPLSALGRIADAHLPTVLVGGAAIVGAVALRRRFPRLPVPMLLVAIGTLLSWWLTLGANGVQIVGVVPSGLPHPALPVATPSELVALLPTAVAIALVGFMESIAVAKVYSAKGRYALDADQELRALGAANIVGSLFQAFPVTGGFSRTAVNAQAGARTQVASLVAVGVIVFTLLFLTPLFHHLPKAILAAIIVVAVAGLIDFRGAIEVWRVDRRDFALMLSTFVATLVLGIEYGILVGAGLSVAVVLDQIARPHIAILGRLPGTDVYRNVVRHRNAVVEPNVAVVRMDASLFFGNAEAFSEAALRSFEATTAVGGPRTLVIDAYPMNRVDSTGLHVLGRLVEEVRAAAGVVLLAGVKGPVADRLARSGMIERIGTDRFFPGVAEAVASVTARPPEPSGIGPASVFSVA